MDNQLRMKIASRRTLSVALVIAGSSIGFVADVAETTPRLAINGYDPVAWFTPGKPTPGSPDISYDWDGARWQFADAAHRELFQRDPDAYTPQ